MKIWQFSILLLIPSLCWSQAVTANMVGTVTDSSGGSVAQAAVTITETNTGVTRKIRTNAVGIYSQPYLPPGLYRIEIENPGFKKFLREKIEVNVATTVRIDAVLEPGQVTETVTVSAEAPLLQTDRADVSRTVTGQAVRELPVPNRSF